MEERGGGGRGRKLEALRATRLRPRFVSDGRGEGRERAAPEGCAAAWVAWEKLVC